VGKKENTKNWQMGRVHSLRGEDWKGLLRGGTIDHVHQKRGGIQRT